MSEEKKKSEIVNIDENGEVIINDPELARMTEELTQDELDRVSAGLQTEALDDNTGCANLGC